MSNSGSAIFVMTLRTLSRDLDVVEKLSNGNECFRAVQNARASLETLRRELIALMQQSGIDPLELFQLELHGAIPQSVPPLSTEIPEDT